MIESAVMLISTQDPVRIETGFVEDMIIVTVDGKRPTSTDTRGHLKSTGPIVSIGSMLEFPATFSITVAGQEILRDDAAVGRYFTVTSTSGLKRQAVVEIEGTDTKSAADYTVHTPIEGTGDGSELMVVLNLVSAKGTRVLRAAI